MSKYVVTRNSTDRSGGPFESFLDCMAAYRETKGDPPLAPWALERICTAQMKHKVKEHWIAQALGIDTYDSYVGLRFDEPERVFSLRARSTQTKTFMCPLFNAGISKQDVLDFWSEQPFDLQIREEQGNCTGCFLKDYSDISRVLGEPETDAAWWFRMEKKFPRFGGDSFPGYAELDRQRPVRLAIEASLRNGTEPVDNGTLRPRLFLNVVRQERKRLAAGGGKAISCQCEASNTPDDDEADENE